MPEMLWMSFVNAPPKAHSCFPEHTSPAICCSPLMTTVHAMHRVCNLGQAWIDLGPNPDSKGRGGDSDVHNQEVYCLGRRFVSC